ncbi:BMP family ABC transporter substrate-binding protein [Phaeobacter sp. J2-8]|uniref:BMP family lipoprotein n=1 Tax=Phaeobacter sp. J2-8 TaxID=2931394 RepID=UPI001FD1A12D|nr:BMP family ABC transporter substrate-binding protein [Phaeobacter sp. J2-8]MCJ7870931.1 BMP family ABC transporter substrate-binding protein [Phaeobacter sp. J2-8]
MKIAVFFVGEVDDAGFNASALIGANAAREMADISVISDVRYDQDAIRARLAEVVPQVDGLIFIGGQGNIATPEIAASFPDKRFAVVQGHKTAANLASYDVRQEDSAFLAGVLAAQLTRTGIVGHLSGHRVPPGLKGRAAFVAGVAHTDPKVQVLTGFCGTQDDSRITRDWAAAEIAAGADIMFTMLNGARSGAIAACREGGAHQIGNALDWVTVDPEVFVGSAIARIDLGVTRAVADMTRHITPERVIQFGLADGEFVDLSMGATVPAEVRAKIAAAAEDIRTGTIHVPESYDGPEFQPEGLTCIMES